MDFSLLLWIALFLGGLYQYLKTKDADWLWVIFATIIFILRSFLNDFLAIDSLSLPLLILGSAFFLYSAYLTFRVRELVNKEYPVLIQTNDIDKKGTINLDQNHIKEQILDKKITLKVGADIWITDGKVDGLARISRGANNWIATNQNGSNRFVSPNWPFHISKIDGMKE